MLKFLGIENYHNCLNLCFLSYAPTASEDFLRTSKIIVER